MCVRIKIKELVHNLLQNKQPLERASIHRGNLKFCFLYFALFTFSIRYLSKLLCTVFLYGRYS